MNAETINAVKDALTPLAEKVGQLGGSVFELAVKQNYVYAVQSFMWGGIGLILSVVYWVNIKKTFRQLEEIAVFPTMIVIFITIISLAVIGEGVGRVINPNWYAIQDIINLVKTQAQ